MARLLTSASIAHVERVCTGLTNEIDATAAAGRLIVSVTEARQTALAVANGIAMLFAAAALDDAGLVTAPEQVVVDTFRDRTIASNGFEARLSHREVT